MFQKNKKTKKCPDYVFIPDYSDKENICIRIRNGKFKDLILNFDTLSVADDEDPPRIVADFNIQTLPDRSWKLKKSLIDRHGPTMFKLEQEVEKIVNDILLQGIQEKEQENE